MRILHEQDWAEWNYRIGHFSGAHILQTSQWGTVKAQYGWQPLAVAWDAGHDQWNAAALVLKKSIKIGGFAAPIRMLYVPKGPLLEWQNANLRRLVLDDLQNLTRQQGAMLIKIDPDVPLGVGIPGQPEATEYPVNQVIQQELLDRGWRFSNEQVQFRNTVLINLAQPEATLFARLKQKTRYNIRLAEKKGVTVRMGDAADIPLLYRMYAETAVRDHFVIRDLSYYNAVWQTFFQAGMAAPLLAEVEGQVVAAIVVFWFAGRAWYLYGMSTDIHRDKMPNYLLQWQAILRLKASGCQVYDLWGAPNLFQPDDPLWGVYRFKEGFNGQVARWLGAWDYPARPLQYRLYTQILPRVLDWMRQGGLRRTRQLVNPGGSL